VAILSIPEVAMDRMEHIHGKLLADDEDRVLVDSVDGYLGFHPRKNGTKSYFGYFEVPPEKSIAIDKNCTCRLVLDDGRHGEIYADVHPCNVPGKVLAEFHVSGDLKK
jgi:hypothetical protein